MYRQAQLIHNVEYTNSRVTYKGFKKNIKNTNNIDDSTLSPELRWNKQIIL